MKSTCGVSWPAGPNRAADRSGRARHVSAGSLFTESPIAERRCSSQTCDKRRKGATIEPATENHRDSAAERARRVGRRTGAGASLRHRGATRIARPSRGSIARKCLFFRPSARNRSRSGAAARPLLLMAFVLASLFRRCDPTTSERPDDLSSSIVFPSEGASHA